MRKLSKSALALLLAGAMAFTPAADILAADNTDNVNLAVMETEDITQESDSAETEGSVIETNTDSTEEKDTNTEVDSNDDNGDDSDSNSDNETDDNNNTDSETGDNKGNNGTDSESGSTDNLDSENVNDSDSENNGSSDPDTETDSDLEDDNADIQDSDAESDLESDDLNSEEKDSEQVSDTETEEFPGLTNYSLSIKQLEDKKNLADHLDEISRGVEGTDYVSKELIFAASTFAEAEKIATAYGAELKDFDEGVGVLILPENISVSHALTVAATSNDVVLPTAWPNYIYKICSDTNENINSDVAVSDDVYLNDNAYTEAVKAYSDPFLVPSNDNYQYQHAMVGSTYAWNAGYTGQGIKIAILDTGVNHHTDLNVVYDYNVSIEDLNSGSANPNDTEDKGGHGTHVAGLAAAKSNTTGGAGIAPGADIYNIRVLNSKGACTAAVAIRGINHAVAQNVDIINMSLGGPGYVGLYDTAIKEAYNAGIAVFAAAGNDGSKVKCYPACYTNAVCVGAVDANKGRTYFSNYGSWVNVSAPGMSLVSTSISGDYSFTVDGAAYEEMEGTSQATPIVSGTAAVILSADESIRSKTGKERVDALISKMNKGKIAGSGGAAGIVSLAKALDIPVSTSAPKAPVFEQTDKIVNGGSLEVSIKAAAPTDVIYYSTDGKNPTYKNGMLDNATQYTGSFTISGSAKITVKAIAVSACGLVSKAASITYTFKPLVSVVNITGQGGLLKGKSTTLKATVEPSYAANKKVSWTSSDPSEVTVSSSGKVTATNSAVVDKVYTITATSLDAGSVAGTFQIIVKDTAKINAVAFKNSAGKAQKSDIITNARTDYDLAPLLKVTDTNKEDIQNPVNEVDFSSSNTQIAVIDSEKPGNIKIKGVGKAVITATANDGSGKKATFTLTVGKKITTLTIGGSSMLAQGKSSKLTAVANKDAANKKYDWSISPEDKGVTVKNGTVKASKTATVGSYTVTATAKDGSGFSASKVIKVSNSTITKIQLDKKSGTIFRVVGNFSSETSINITANITGGDGSGIEFTSSNPGVATVTQNGVVATITATGKAVGTTKITCKSANGKSASCTIKVVNPPSHLAITSPAGFSEFVAKGKKIKLSAVFEEEFGSVSSKNVTWESDNKSVATVDKSGSVKGIEVGTATIRATANDGSGLTAQYIIYVSEPIKTLGLSGFEASGELVHVINVMQVNKIYSIPILYNGSMYFRYDSLVCPNVAIEVGNPDIISVQQSNYGVYEIHTLKTGSTSITVKALDGTGVKKSYSVKVQ